MKPISKFIVANGAGVSTLTASIDTRGFSYAQIVASATITNGLHTTAANTILEESDDNSTFTTVGPLGRSRPAVDGSRGGHDQRRLPLIA